MIFCLITSYDYYWRILGTKERRLNTCCCPFSLVFCFMFSTFFSGLRALSTIFHWSGSIDTINILAKFMYKVDILMVFYSITIKNTLSWGFLMVSKIKYSCYILVNFSSFKEFSKIKNYSYFYGLAYSYNLFIVSYGILRITSSKKCVATEG